MIRTRPFARSPWSFPRDRRSTPRRRMRSDGSPSSSPTWRAASGRSAMRSAPTSTSRSASGGSSGSRTRPVTDCAPSSMPIRPSRSFVGSWWARRAPWPSSRRRFSRQFRSDDGAELGALQAEAAERLGGRELLREAEFTADAELTELFWRVREGMHGIVGRLRPQGTVLIVEDVCVPPERIAESATDIQALLGKHGFLPGVAGHTSAGNLHFMLTPDFGKAEDRDRYEAFMEKLVALILDKYDGSLKA